MAYMSNLLVQDQGDWFCDWFTWKLDEATFSRVNSLNVISGFEIGTAGERLTSIFVQELMALIHENDVVREADIQGYYALLV